MKRGTAFFALFVAITLLIALAVQHSTQAQRQDRPGTQAPRGRRGSFMITRAANLESYWVQLCLEMKITDQAMIEGRKIFVKAMEDRTKVIEGLEAAGGDEEAMNAATSKAGDIRTDVLAKLKGLLSSKEMEEFTKWEEAQRQQQRQRMRTPPGPPGN